jgi:hypothetical protein
MASSAWSLAWLEELGLLVSQPEQALICQRCQFALKVNDDRAFQHLADKHRIGLELRADLTRYIRSLSLADPTHLHARPDGLPPHPALAIQRGYCCRRCDFRTSSYQLIRRHASQQHGLRRQTWSPGDYQVVFLRSWTSGGPHQRPWWIVSADAVDPQLLRPTAGSDLLLLPTAGSDLLLLPTAGSDLLLLPTAGPDLLPT